MTDVQLDLDGDYVPAHGEVFTVVSATSLSGQFHELKEGDSLVVHGVSLTVRYTGTTVSLHAPALVGTRIDITVVGQRTTTVGQGEVAALPGDEAWVHEWQSFWVEIWVSTSDSMTVGVAEARVNLQYHSGYLTAQEIIYGPVWDHPVIVIDDQANFVTLHGWTEGTDVGDDAYVLLARVRFASTGEDQVPVVAEAGFLGPYDMAMTLEDGQIRLVNRSTPVPELGGSPSTELWAVMYDFGSVEANIEEDNQIDFGDFSFFAAAFGKLVGPSSPP